MSTIATVKSLRQARRLLKGLMNHHHEGWQDWREGSRQAVKQVLEERMQGQVRLCVPKTRSSSDPRGCHPPATFRRVQV
jgi:hypothetical protein